jgi:hypothetical protein
VTGGVTSTNGHAVPQLLPGTSGLSEERLAHDFLARRWLKEREHPPAAEHPLTRFARVWPSGPAHPPAGALAS